jgi:hypothetical protein
VIVLIKLLGAREFTVFNPPVKTPFRFPPGTPSTTTPPANGKGPDVAPYLWDAPAHPAKRAVDPAGIVRELIRAVFHGGGGVVLAKAPDRTDESVMMFLEEWLIEKSIKIRDASPTSTPEVTLFPTITFVTGMYCGQRKSDIVHPLRGRDISWQK